VTALVCHAPGKVNLCLFVAAPREDGLHPLVSVIVPVSLADEVRLEAAPPGTPHDEVICPGVWGPNLAADALSAYRARTGWDAPPQRLTITKRVPVAAGMGGGSADAAAALRLASHAAGRPDDPAAAAIAPRLGSDVPAALAARPCLVTAAGEEVELLGEPAPLGLLVLPSGEALSTPAVYREYDRLALGRPPGELPGLTRRVRAAVDGGLPAELLHNDLEAAARSLAPSVAAALDAARAAGAAQAMVSGSGPTVFGLFPGPDGPAHARAAAGSVPGAIAAEPVGPAFARPLPAEP
jgi:4-diphosphocytidyl-2-C-methyl-D-erythritol kinase